MKRFRACTLVQPFLMAPSLRDWPAEDHLARFIARVAEMLEEAGRTDEEEDSRCGPGRRDDGLPEPPRTAAGPLEKIRAAKQELEREARDKAEQVRQERAAQRGRPRDAPQKKRWQRTAAATGP